MTEKKWIVLALFVASTAPLHWMAIRWLSERHAFCRDGTIVLIPNSYQPTPTCDYPEQVLSIEDGKTEKLGICRCKR